MLADRRGITKTILESVLYFSSLLSSVFHSPHILTVSLISTLNIEIQCVKYKTIITSSVVDSLPSRLRQSHVEPEHFSDIGAPFNHLNSTTRIFHDKSH